MVVSVIMITYNHEKFISQAIEGVLSQECDFDVELMIYDDCSNDKTEDIVNSYIKNHPKNSWITYLRHEKNVGGNKNFVLAFENAKGDFIAYCEGDDYWFDKNKLQKQVDFLRNNPEYVICYHNSNVIDQNNKIIKNTFIDDLFCKDYSKEEIKKYNFIQLMTCCFRNCIEEYPVELQEKIAADMFILSLLGHYGKGKYMHNIGVGASYRIHDGGVHSSISDINKLLFRAKSMLELVKYYERTSETDLHSYFKDRYKWTINETIKLAFSQKKFILALNLFLKRIKPTTYYF